MMRSDQIISTVSMIQKDNLDVRTITMGINLLDCRHQDVDVMCRRVVNKIEKYAGDLVDVCDQIVTKYGVPIVNKRLAVRVNTLRLWSAKAYNEIDLENFNRGEYVGAVMNKMKAETLTKVLYPNDNTEQGKELRLRQQYFFVSCTLQDILRRHVIRENTLDTLPEKVFMQLNDTHPTLVIPELMRILVDENEMEWDDAWRITTACVGYTNHTILPEALETWGLERMRRLLPRHVQIIGEINFRFLGLVRSMYHDGIA